MSMPDDVFVDTNVLVYAHDADAGEKHRLARRLVAGLWQSKPLPWISVQVLQEMLVTLQRKNVPLAEACRTVEDYAHWRVVENDIGLFRAGMTEMERWKISFWDALILSAARQVGAMTVLSEDLNDEQDYGGISIVNPFRAP
jgi:predicted nucleic acid-binding protein